MDCSGWFRVIAFSQLTGRFIKSCLAAQTIQELYCMGMTYVLARATTLPDAQNQWDWRIYHALSCA
ncbi:protein of unknown function [Georgfuchsia toluolica]|uniref:Uncharacterized protein n=1 Tax=Georgfuchsia toluolica TaxID=424218 RepID=A0A916NA22_9PROT|nr:protein of unknown function [Georgfuchsia toluolica]